MFFLNSFRQRPWPWMVVAFVVVSSLCYVMGWKPAVGVATLQQGEVWRCLTYSVGHGNVWHLVLNCLFCLWLGVTLERAWGAARMGALMALTAIGGSLGFLVSVALDPRLAPSTLCMGASAVVTGLWGAVVGAFPRARIVVILGIFPIPARGWWLVICMLLMAIFEAYWFPYQTAYGAHLGGFATGVIVGCLFRGVAEEVVDA